MEFHTAALLRKGIPRGITALPGTVAPLSALALTDSSVGPYQPDDQRSDRPRDA